MFNKFETNIEYLSKDPITFEFHTVPHENDKHGNPKPVKNYKSILLYGRNGSGKSSIANRLYGLSKEGNEKIITDSDSMRQHFSFYNVANKKKTTLVNFENTNGKIYSYSDDFINDKINFTENSNLEAIVMLGEQGKIQEEINELEYKKNKSKEENDEMKRDKKTGTEENQQLLNIIEATLKADNGWADKDRFIKGNKQKTAVNEKTIRKLHELGTQIIEEEQSKKLEDSQNKYTSLKEKLRTIREKNKLPPLLKLEKLNHNIDDQISTALGKVIEKPKLTEREELIIKIVSSEGISILERIKKDTNNDYCPTCFREIDEELKESLKESLESVHNNIMNDEVEKLKDKIKKIHIPDQPSLSNKYEIENIPHVSEYNKVLEEYRRLKQQYEELLEKKMDKIFTKLMISETIKIFDAYSELIEKFNLISREVENYNEAFLNEEQIKTEAYEVNNLVTAITLFDKIKTYYEEMEKIADLVTLIEEHDDEYQLLQGQIQNKLAELKQTRIALSEINEYLKFIFFDNERLKLEHSDKGYVVHSHGSEVKLNNLSDGEKKIISLCYFFSLINQNKSKNDFFKDEVFIILDDPITSVDLNNQVGIYSYLRSQFEKILKGNENSKILTLTHDYGILHNLSRVFDDLTNRNHLVFDLNNGKLTKRNVNQITDGYKNDLIDLYKYASNEDEDEIKKLSSSIGNLMRRTLESYSTFIYGVGISELSTDAQIIESLESKDKEVFNSLMYRLLAHGGSHSQITAQNYSNIINMNIDDREKLKLARLTLYFLYSLNPLHITKHIDKKFDVNKVLSWKEIYNS